MAERNELLSRFGAVGLAVLAALAAVAGSLRLAEMALQRGTLTISTAFDVLLICLAPMIVLAAWRALLAAATAQSRALLFVRVLELAGVLLVSVGAYVSHLFAPDSYWETPVVASLFLAGFVAFRLSQRKALRYAKETP